MATLETSVNSIQNHQQINENVQNNQSHIKLSRYELSREERIKENLERMEKLGILDLSLKLKSLHNPTPRNNNKSYNRKTPQRVEPLPPSGPVRRSSRLQNSTPVSYSEVNLSKKDLSLEGKDELISEGAKPEFYTEEHEKLLGDTNMSWTLFVDGYGKDGKRIYDPVRGKTCHQCRQKTLGHRTNCCKCSMVQGQFCGDCLYMRYGENVLEANQNPDWICPPCRGICNCSLCRQAKGWPPTGTLYRKISCLGFKSVAHYLIQTKRANADLENISSNKKPASAKRSLPFSDEEPTSPENESTESSNDLQGLEKPEARHNETNHDIKIVKEEGEEILDIEAPESIPQPSKDCGMSTLEIEDKKKDDEFMGKKEGQSEEQMVEEHCNDQALSKTEPEEKKIDDEFRVNKEEMLQVLNITLCEKNVAIETSVKSRKKPRLVAEPMLDSIGGRLRQRRSKGCGN
ncbi:hypothetical protein LguiA_006168 [Lonicera macranthoides]